MNQKGLRANGEEPVHDGVPAGVYVRIIFAIHARTIRISVRSVRNYFGDLDPKDDPSVCGPMCHQYEYVRNLSVWNFRKLVFLNMCKPVFLLAYTYSLKEEFQPGIIEKQIKKLPARKEEMLENLTATTVGKLTRTFLLSMVPVIELRGGLPYGIALGLDYPLALAAAVLGNMVPVPLIILYIRHIFHWLRKQSPWWHERIEALERKAHLKGRLVRKYRTLGLCILVAIPLPGTGAWTGALVAAVLDMRLKDAVPTIFLGVCIAAGIMTAVTFGVIHIL